MINAEFVIENQKLSITSLQAALYSQIPNTYTDTTSQQKLFTSSLPKDINSQQQMTLTINMNLNQYSKTNQLRYTGIDQSLQIEQFSPIDQILSS
jgi:hypothetical protein